MHLTRRLTSLRAMLAHLLARLPAAEQPEVDPLSGMSRRDWADLPTFHPAPEPEDPGVRRARRNSGTHPRSAPRQRA